MPRSKKTIYEKIAEKRQEIEKTEIVLKKIQSELSALESERDDQEMHILFQAMKSNNLDLEKTLKMLNK